MNEQQLQQETETAVSVKGLREAEAKLLEWIICRASGPEQIQDATQRYLEIRSLLFQEIQQLRTESRRVTHEQTQQEEAEV